MGAPPNDAPHDTLFRSVFERPDHAAGLLRLVLPPRLVRHLGLGGLRLAPSVFADQVVGTRQADVLYEVPLEADPERCLYVVIEHQSTAHPRMPHRMLDYSLRSADGVLRKASGTTLPAVVPVLVTHAPGGFDGPSRLTELLDLPADVRAALGSLVFEHRVIVYDLERKSDRAIVRSRATPLGRVALLFLKHARVPGLAARIPRWAPLLRRVWRDEGPDAIETLARYALTVSDEGAETLKAAFERVLVQAGEVIVTAAEKLRREGMELGLEKGREEGRQEGRQEGREQGREEGSRQARRETLLRQLRLKFGDVPPEAQARLEAAAPADLDRWLDRVLTADSCDDVFAP